MGLGQIAQQALALDAGYSAMIEKMRQEVLERRESVMTMFITKELGTTVLPSPEEIKRRGGIVTHDDGYEVFSWDGVPRILFRPVGMKEVDGRQRLVQTWEMIPVPVEDPLEEEPDH